MQYDNYLHIAKCTNFIAADQLDRLLDDCACWFSLHELSLTGRFSKQRRFSKIRSSWVSATELDSARPPVRSAASAARCAAPPRLHLFLAMEPLVPAALRIAY